MRVGGRPPAPAGPMAAPGCGHGAFPSRFPSLHLGRDVCGKVTSQCVTRVPCHRGLTAPARRFKPQLTTTHVPSTWRGRMLKGVFLGFSPGCTRLQPACGKESMRTAWGGRWVCPLQASGPDGKLKNCLTNMGGRSSLQVEGLHCFFQGG